MRGLWDTLVGRADCSLLQSEVSERACPACAAGEAREGKRVSGLREVVVAWKGGRFLQPEVPKSAAAKASLSGVRLPGRRGLVEDYAVPSLSWAYVMGAG